MLNLKPHTVAHDKSTQSDRLLEVDPYIRILHAERYENSAGKICYRTTPALFLQQGRYYTEDGKEITELPSWAAEEIAKISAAALQEAGFPVSSYGASDDGALPKKRGRAEAPA